MSGTPMIDNKEIHELLELLDEQVVKDELLLAKLRRMIDKIKNVELALYHCYMGMYYCLKNDPDNAQKEHEKSIQMEPLDNFYKLNYGITLRRLKLDTKSLMVLLEAHESDRAELDVLIETIDAAYIAQQFETMKELLDRYHLLTPVPHQVEQFIVEDEEDIENIDKIVAEADLEGWLPADTVFNS